MAEEATSITTESVKKSSDGMVKISIEKYNEMVEKHASQQREIDRVRERLQKALSEPPVINRTIVHKTEEMLADENRLWGNTLMGLGAAMFVVGAFRRKAGLTD